MAQRQDQTIEAEVDQYLSDQVTEHWSLQFWQVYYCCILFFYYFISDSPLYRIISFSIARCSLLQWILYQFKPPVCLLSESSPQAKKPWHLVNVALNQH